MGRLHPWREQSLESSPCTNHFQIFFLEQLSGTYCCLSEKTGVAWQCLPFIGCHQWVNTPREAGKLPSAASTHMCPRWELQPPHTRLVQVIACSCACSGQPNKLLQEQDWSARAKQSQTLQPGAPTSIAELCRHRNFTWNSHWLKHRNYPETRHHGSRLPLLHDFPNYSSRACSSMP